MAQVEEFLGGSEAEDPQDRQPIAGADALATSLAMDAARASPQLSDKAGAYLDSQARLVERQARLVDIQAQDLIEQRALQTSHLRLRRFTERLKAATQVVIVLLAIVVGLGLAIMLSDAFSSRSVVVDAFEAPPALAARGLSGTVVASAVLDQLQKLQAATRSATKLLDTRSAWASDIKIQAPGTGVSIGEIDRLLHARFGHDTHVGGDLVQTDAGGLALTVRGDGVPAQTFQGGGGDLGKLTGHAAEYIYGRSQPYQFANYLTANGRDGDALAFIPTAYAQTANADERFKLAVIWGNAYYGLNMTAPAVEKFRLALALKPGDWMAWGNLVAALQVAQGEEAAWREGQAMLRAVAKAPKDKRPKLHLLGAVADVSLDMPLALASNLEDAALNGGAGTSVSIAGPQIADDYGVMHDQTSAARYLAASDPQDSTTKAETLLLAGYGALDRGDYAGAVPPLEAFWTAWQADPSLRRSFQDYPCFLGLADGMTGRMGEAEAVFKRIGPWSRCIAMHGEVLEHAGDLAGAQRVWAEGIRVGPDLSPVYLQRGVSEANRGDLAAATADLAAANARSPHWADSLKAWGDLLAREGRWKDALAKYDGALKYAPAWAALRQARAAAARHG